MPASEADVRLEWIASKWFQLYSQERWLIVWEESDKKGK